MSLFVRDGLFWTYLSQLPRWSSVQQLVLVTELSLFWATEVHIRRTSDLTGQVLPKKWCICHVTWKGMYPPEGLWEGDLSEQRTGREGLFDSSCHFVYNVFIPEYIYYLTSRSLFVVFNVTKALLQIGSMPTDLALSGMSTQRESKRSV